MLRVQQDTKISFSMHNEIMKEFRRSHGEVAMVNATAVVEGDLRKRTTPLTISYGNAGGGGSHLPEQNATRSTTLELSRVAKYKLWPN
jgi:hypothetical protein